MANKLMYANRCFGLPADQIRYFSELTPEQLEQVYYHFGSNPKANASFVYAVKQNGDLVVMRERLRPEWETTR